MPEKMLLLLDQITLLHTIATHCCSIKLAIAKARQNAETLIKLHSICKKGRSNRTVVVVKVACLPTAWKRLLPLRKSETRGSQRRNAKRGTVDVSWAARRMGALALLFRSRESLALLVSFSSQGLLKAHRSAKAPLLLFCYAQLPLFLFSRSFQPRKERPLRQKKRVAQPHFLASHHQLLS